MYKDLRFVQEVLVDSDNRTLICPYKDLPCGKMCALLNQEEGRGEYTIRGKVFDEATCEGFVFVKCGAKLIGVIYPKEEKEYIRRRFYEPTPVVAKVRWYRKLYLWLTRN
jgi:hypothetical protein